MEESVPDGELSLEDTFPGLAATDYEITSDYSRDYNCLAWALHDNSRKWQASPGYYWPKDVPYDDRAETLVAYLQTIGFVLCDDAEHETGIEKIAVFASAGEWQHAARQLLDGKWTSKLGNREDISHESAADVECEDYGTVLCYLKRQIAR